MSVTQTQWDAVSKFNLFACGCCSGAAIMYLVLHGADWWLLGLLVFAALVNWQSAHIQPRE